MPLPNDLTNLDENKPDGSVIPVAQLDDYQREHRGYTKGWAGIEHNYNGRHAFAVGGNGGHPVSPTPVLGTIYINTDTGTIEYWNGAAWVSANPFTVIPSGTVMLFRQGAAPAGWTRVVDGGNTDAVIRVLLNNEVLADGGTWNVSGLTTTLGAHRHEAPECLHSAFGGGEEHVDDPVFPVSGFNRVFFRVSVLADIGGTLEPTVMTGATDLGTPPVASDGSWRPKHVDVIAAIKA